MARDALRHTQVSREYARVVERRLPMFEATPPDWLDCQWERGLKDLEKFDTVCREAGVPWVLLIVPTEIQVDDAVRSAVLTSLERKPTDLDLDRPQRRIQSWAAEHGVNLLDPTDYLRTACRSGEHFYLSNNPHWNECGSRLMGGLLGERIAAILGVL